MQEKYSHNVDFILTRLKSALKIGTDKNIAEFLGVSPQAISTWRKRNSIDYDLLFAKCGDLNLNWLIRGTGEDPEIKGDKTSGETLPPGPCKMCLDKEKTIFSQAQTIKALNDLIEYMKAREAPVQHEQKRKKAG
jgi:hypothetical protein